MPSIDSYLGRITPSHADKPNFVATVQALVKPLVDSQVTYLSLLTTFDIDTAIGVQLDAVGQWVGRSRQVLQPISGAYFSFDTTGLGFDQGAWKGPFDSVTGITTLDDDTYRRLLKAKIIMNSWDGTIATIAKALSTLFGDNPNVDISIEDNFDMTMTVGLSGQVPSSVELALLQGGYVPISPSGVLVNYVVTSVNQAALFGFDTENLTVAGFDQGSWAGQPGTGPSAPLSLSLVSATQTSLTLSWLPPAQGSGPYTYQLEYQLQGANSVWVLVPNISTTTTGMITGLSPNATYTVAVYAVNSTGPGQTSPSITASTSVGIPAQVTGLQAASSSTTSIALLWNAIAGNNITYQVQSRVTGSNSAFTNAGPAVSTTSDVIAGLTQGLVYDFQVYAISSVGQGPTSSIISIGTSGAVPGLVQNLVVTDVDNTTLGANWNQPVTGNGPYNYLVQIAQNVSPITYTTVIASITTSPTGGAILIPNLQSKTSYLVRVAATNSGGPGQYCAPVTAVTAVGGASQVSNVQVAPQSGSTVSLTWGSATNAASYQIQYQTIGATSFVNSGSPVTTTNGTVTGLTAGASYNFQVVGITSAGASGPPSLPIAVTTPGSLPAQVTNLVASNPTLTSMTLLWNASQGSGTVLYQPAYRISGFPTWTPFGGLIAATQIVVTGLQSGVSYDFQITPQNSLGAGTPSTPVVASTSGTSASVSWSSTDHSANLTLSNNNLTVTANSQLLPPIMVPNVTTSNITGTGITLSWNATFSPNYYGVRASTSFSTGKRYVEFAMTSSVASFAVGLANGFFDWNAAGQKGLGYDNNSLGIFPVAPAQSVYSNGVSLVSSATVADITGDVVSLAIDFDNHQFWFSTTAMRTRLGASAWNNSATANPSTNTGGIVITTLTSGSYFPAFNAITPGCSCTINTGGSAFTMALPTNFVAWNSSNSTSVINPPGAVSGISVGTATFNTIPVTWAATSGATSYKVTYALASTPNVLIPGPTTTNTSATLANLLPNTNYDIYVEALNTGGLGPVSAAVVSKTVLPANSIVPYRGVNLTGSDLSAVSSIPVAYPHANACVIPVFISTASQTSTDVVLTTTLTTVGGWIDAANTAGLKVFLGVYLTCRDGTPRQTITPGPSLSAVASFFTNLQAVCAQVATLGQTHNAVGMWCGVDVAPWAGLTAGDTGPFSGTHVTQWQAIYLACKAVWPAGIIGYAASQHTIGLAAPTSDFAVDFSIWDVICFDIYPGSNNAYTAVTDFETYFDTQPDPDVGTVSSTGPIPLFQALVNYSNQLGRPLFINSCGIIPADGNQVAPNAHNVLPPPYDFIMQSAFWTAVMYEVTKHASNFAGFFVSDGGSNTYNSPYTGVNYYGLQGLAAASNIDAAYSGLMGNGPGVTLTAPTNVVVTATNTSTISISWSAISGTNVVYEPQIGTSASSVSAASISAATTYTFINLLPNTTYYINVFAVQGAVSGPVSTTITGQTTGTSVQSINITQPPANLPSSSPILIQGTLNGYAAAPNLSYFDDDVIPQVSNVVVSNSNSSGFTLNWTGVTVAETGTPISSNTATAFSFNHPAMPPGTHTLIVTDGKVSSLITYNVVTSVGTVSANDTVITMAQERAGNFNLSITDSGLNVYGINSGQQITLNGAVDTTTSNVTQIAYVNNVIWYQDASNLWRSKASSKAAWLPTAGMATGPFSSSNTLTLSITAPTNVVANTPFSFTGTLIGYSSGVVPPLAYSDDAGTNQVFPVTSTITSTSFTLPHPGITAGTHTLRVFDMNSPSSTSSVSYSVSASNPVTLITAPLSTATVGTWTTSSLTANGVTTQYLALMPYGYSTNNTYPVLVYLHQDQVTSIAALQTQVDLWFNTVAWREAYPCIVLVPYLDQTNALTPNWGGITTATSPAENNVVQLIQTFQANYSVAVGHTMLTGTGAGACGGWDLVIKYNRLTGTQNKLIDCFLSMGGSVFTYGSPTPISSVTSALTNFPIYCIHGTDPTGVPPTEITTPTVANSANGVVLTWGAASSGANYLAAWEKALYIGYGGPTTYGGSQAPNSKMSYLLDGGQGVNVWDAYFPLPSGKPFWDWMYSIGTKLTAVTPINTNNILTPGSGGSVTDTAGNVFTLPANGTLTENGNAVVNGDSTGGLTSVSGVIWARDANSGTWYTYVNGVFIVQSGQPPNQTKTNPTVSPDGTIINSVGPVITDANGVTWGLNATGNVVVNGIADATTAATIELVYKGGLIYQENSSQNWWQKSKPTDTWAATTSPVTVVVINPGSGTRVTVPLTGPVTTGVWVTNQRMNSPSMPNGYMQYNYLLPAQYDPTLLYPLLIVGHPNDDGMNGGSYPRDGATFINGEAYGTGLSINSIFNNVTFRTNFPYIIVAPQCDQSIDGSGANGNSNFGGYADSQNSGANEQAVNLIAQHMIASFPIDPSKRHGIGYSLGAIGFLSWLVDNNQFNGPSGLNLWTAGVGLSDQLYRPSTPNSNVFTRMANVPYLAVSTTSDNNPSSYDIPAWQNYTGNSNYPTKSTYDSGGMAAIRAGTSKFYYINYGSANPANTFMALNANGGDATAIWNWLYSQVGPAG